MPDFKPPDKIEDLYASTGGNQFAAINAPTSGARPASGDIRDCAARAVASASCPSSA